MEFTRLEFLRMINVMQRVVIERIHCNDPEDIKTRGEEKDLLKKLDELWSRASVDRDKIFIIGIKD